MRSTRHIDKNLGADKGITLQALKKLNNSRYHFVSEYYEAIPCDEFFSIYGTNFTMETTSQAQQKEFQHQKQLRLNGQDPIIEMMEEMKKEMEIPLPCLFIQDEEACASISQSDVSDFSKTNAWGVK